MSNRHYPYDTQARVITTGQITYYIPSPNLVDYTVFHPYNELNHYILSTYPLPTIAPSIPQPPPPVNEGSFGPKTPNLKDVLSVLKGK